jgi:N6-adenosine-specific RNA methylase IME4
MKFKLIYADPPWQYRNSQKSKKFSGTAASAYETHSDSDISAWDVGSIADANSLLFLWATFPKMPEALSVMAAWGFKFVTAPFVWNKTYASGKPFCGVGFWTRNAAEVVLLGRRGKGLPRIARGIRQVVTAPVERPHSTKPAIVRSRIIELVGDVRPRIELFARQETEDWYATGLELDGRLLTDAIQYYTAL